MLERGEVDGVSPIGPWMAGLRLLRRRGAAVALLPYGNPLVLGSGGSEKGFPAPGAFGGGGAGTEAAGCGIGESILLSDQRQSSNRK